MNEGFPSTLVIYLCIANHAQNLVVWDNKYLLSHSSYVSGIWKQLSWVVLAQSPSWGCSQDVSWGAVIRAPDWGSVPFPDGPLTRLLAGALRAWLAAGRVPPFSPWAAWVPSPQGCQLSAEWVIQERAGRRPRCLLCPGHYPVTPTISYLLEASHCPSPVQAEGKRN